MVPAGTPCGHGSTLPSQSSPCRALVFPPWTRDDDDDEARHIEIKRNRKIRRGSGTGVRRRRSSSGQKPARGAATKRSDSSSVSSDDSDSDSDHKQKKQNAATSPISSPDAVQVADPLALSSKPRPPPLPLPKNKEEFTPSKTLDSIPGPLNTLEGGPPPGAVSKAEDNDDRHRKYGGKSDDSEHEEREDQRFRANGPDSPRSPRFSDFEPAFPMMTAPPRLGSPTSADFPFVQSPKERKGLQPVVTVTEPAASDRTPVPVDSVQTPPPMVIMAPAPVHHGLHSDAEKALIAVGSIGATVIVFFVAWFAWKCYKMHKRSHERNFWQTHATPSMSLDGMVQPGGTSRRSDFQSSLGLNRPKQFMMNVASRVPFLKERVAMRSWSNLDKQHDDAVWAEKRLPVLHQQGHQRSSSGITVHTDIMTKSERGGESSATWSLPHQGPVQQQFRPTPRSNNTLSGISDVSSLSSGFGDGDIIMPPAVMGTATTTTVTAVAVPPPVASRSSVSTASRSYRDTVYTETTEASEDAVPRFRTINSWVRQQSGRIKRAKMTASDAPPLPNAPPEQDFRLMMPDNEEPRRVDETASPSGYIDESDIIAGYGASELASQSGYERGIDDDGPI
ncbi:hypothetical protein CP533_2731 [Ophiocordyceps camponoti-saundersi (nom. inval.)]|nr:hypothetical protein CP533_2731 [Ophiocordyceps camponoti-saundersi (nom. inval.)]